MKHNGIDQIAMAESVPPSPRGSHLIVDGCNRFLAKRGLKATPFHVPQVSQKPSVVTVNRSDMSRFKK